MKIESVNIFSFRLPLSRRLTMAGIEHNHRTGYLIEMIDSEGRTGWGEASPLPGFSQEKFAGILPELHSAAELFTGSTVPSSTQSADSRDHRKQLSSALDPDKTSPSVRFGLESAWLNLLSNSLRLHFGQLIGQSPVKKIPVNALLMGTPNEVLQRVELLRGRGYESFKLKIGKRSLSDDAGLVRKVRDLIGSANLRLDCNRIWDVETTISFWNKVADCNIEYIEEPLTSLGDYRYFAEEIDKLRLRVCPIALDESLSHSDFDLRELMTIPNLKGIVIKPTMLGLEESLQLAWYAGEHGIKPVISSSFESSVGISILAEIAAAVSPDCTAAGLDTIDFFAEDSLSEPVCIEQGAINISDLPDIDATIRREILTLEKRQ